MRQILGTVLLTGVLTYVLIKEKVSEVSSKLMTEALDNSERAKRSARHKSR